MLDKLKIFKEILGEDYDQLEEDLLVEELENNVNGEEVELLVDLLDKVDTDRYEEGYTFAPRLLTLTFDNGLILTVGKGFSELA